MCPDGCRILMLIPPPVRSVLLQPRFSLLEMFPKLGLLAFAQRGQVTGIDVMTWDETQTEAKGLTRNFQFGFRFHYRTSRPFLKTSKFLL